jgi:outer membrane protein assembly factor BamA
MQQLTVSYATLFGNFAVEYQADFYSLLKSGRLNLLVAATQQFITRYFGYGNETAFNKSLQSNDYYHVNQNLTTIFPTIFYAFSKRIEGGLGISFIRTNTTLNNESLLSGFKYGNYGLGVIKPFGIHIGLTIDGKDHQEYPLNGYWMKFYARIFPDLYGIPASFYMAGFDLRKYLTPEMLSFATLALRAGGSKVFNQYPFYAGATVGGQNNLRGYNEGRFSGDASVFGQAELRLFITHLNIILKSKLGINLFAETGRVFATGESSEKWHPSYGAGLWVAYLNSTIIGSTYIAFSPETTIFNLGFGMAF